MVDTIYNFFNLITGVQELNINYQFFSVDFLNSYFRKIEHGGWAVIKERIFLRGRLLSLLRVSGRVINQQGCANATLFFVVF